MSSINRTLRKLSIEEWIALAERLPKLNSMSWSPMMLEGDSCENSNACLAKSRYCSWPTLNVRRAQYQLGRAPCQSMCLWRVRTQLTIIKIYCVAFLPRDITFPSAHHSPTTVNRNASELVMGTVRLNSINIRTRYFGLQAIPKPTSLADYDKEPNTA
jgi:hypothetical protein